MKHTRRNKNKTIIKIEKQKINTISNIKEENKTERKKTASYCEYTRMKYIHMYTIAIWTDTRNKFLLL